MANEYPQGWRSDRGETVWAMGHQYTETGSAPGRVVIMKFAGHHGVISSWSWVSDLKPANPRGVLDFVEAVASHHAREIAALNRRIADHETLVKSWKMRANRD